MEKPLDLEHKRKKRNTRSTEIEQKNGTPPTNGKRTPASSNQTSRVVVTDDNEQNTKTARSGRPTTTNQNGQLRQRDPSNSGAVTGRMSTQRGNAEDRAESTSSHHHQQVLHFERRFGFSGSTYYVYILLFFFFFGTAKNILYKKA
jgi:hypothetical protein